MAEQSNDPVAVAVEQSANPLSRRLFLAGVTATAALAATAAGGSAASAQVPSAATDTGRGGGSTDTGSTDRAHASCGP